MEKEREAGLGRGGERGRGDGSGGLLEGRGRGRGAALLKRRTEMLGRGDGMGWCSVRKVRFESLC